MFVQMIAFANPNGNCRALEICAGGFFEEPTGHRQSGERFPAVDGTRR